MTITGTLHEILTYSNPALRLDDQQSGAVTRSQLYKDILEEDITDWGDFTYENITAAYGHLFDIGPITSEAYPDLRGTPTEIEKESHVDNLGTLWNAQICRYPLKRGAERVLRDLGLEQQDISLRHDGKSSVDLGSDSKAKAPDWSIYIRDESKTVIVWGDSKCSSKWASDPANLPPGFRSNFLWPYRQLLTYCVNDSMRYGFILTPEELVATRVVQGSQQRWRIQYKSIPWRSSGATLTVNLAIWALAMMALNEGHRPIRSEADTLPLDVWWRDGTEMEHHLSGRRVTQLPAGAAARPRPATIPAPAVAEVLDRSKRRRRR